MQTMPGFESGRISEMTARREQPATNSTFSRRTLLQRGGQSLPLAGAAALAVSGQPLATAEAAALPSVLSRIVAASRLAQPSGTLNWARAYKGRTKDPHALYSLQEMVILGQVMEPLVSLDNEGNFVPVLAEEWSTSEDGLTWTFKLREGVTFHDGTPFTAEAVKASIERTKDNPESGYAFMFTNYADPPATVVDDFTVELTTQQPEVAMLNNLTVFYILPPEAATNTDMSYDAAIGTGPFTLVEYDIDRVYQYEANPDYWQADLPKVQSVNSRPIIEQSSLAASTLAGELDIVEGLTPDNLALFRDNPDFEVIEDQLWRLGFLIFNQASDVPALADPKVRQAMSFAIDRAVITEDLLGGTAIPWSTYPPQGLVGATTTYPANPFDLDKARELMAESSAPDGFQATLRVPSGFANGKATEISQLVAQQLQEIGITLEVETGEQTAVTTDYRAGDYQIGYLQSVAVTGDATRYLNERYIADSYKMGYENPEVNDLIRQISTTLDLDERLALFEDLHALLWEDTPVLYLMQEQSSFVLRNVVSGFEGAPTQVYDVKDVSVS